ncbi:zinc finger protein 33A-like [Chrysoperla carnea]|uniref:zinc finger protein 33A-like n=1 Tax=Chrysoperla carnea TaxID=189513 RepID=UPI001D0676F3|nr:zinc finger protein 33A-like [Chrysoperla carnea]
MNENLCSPNLQISFQKICRTCLTENEGLQRICRIVDLLKECTSIHVDMADDLPKLICLECTKKLNIAFLFRKQCELSEKTLLQLREFKETSIKHEKLERNEVYIKSEGSNDLHKDNLYTCDENNTFKINNVLSFENTKFNENKNSLDDTKIKNSSLEGNHKTAKKNLLCDFDDQLINERLFNEHNDSVQEDNDYEIPDQLCSDQSVDSKTNKWNNKFKGSNRKLKIKINRKLKEETNYNTITDGLVCLDCEKSFELEGDLEIHMLKHQKFDNFICPKCSKSFANRHNLRRHLNTHMITKPFKCKFCDKSFAAPGDRNRHLRLHTGEKPYICTTCGKAYTDSSRLSKHMKYHSDVKDFACTVCPKSFLFPNALRVHMRVHTGEKPYLCTECGDSFKSALSLKTHERKHTRDVEGVEEELFCCNICRKILTSNQSLSKHRRTHSKGK